MDYETLLKTVRTWGVEGDRPYDFNGVVHLMLACLQYSGHPQVAMTPWFMRVGRWG